MQKRRPIHETRSARVRRQGWLRAGVWIFILVFVFSVAGGMIIFGIQVSGK
jgi:di/tricarboxylate transporter